MKNIKTEKSVNESLTAMGSGVVKSMEEKKIIKPQKPQALKLKIWGRVDNARSLIQETKGPLKKVSLGQFLIVFI
ncbi:hypothetical protein HanRHA438_Chr16g0769431 [Helianthus annuus]|nr:hypothetical protein HanRHA438_Chr16g0769431 [Helianthus annuus]